MAEERKEHKEMESARNPNVNTNIFLHLKSAELSSVLNDHILKFEIFHHLPCSTLISKHL